MQIFDRAKAHHVRKERAFSFVLSLENVCEGA
jgi:hypothetical protein